MRNQESFSQLTRNQRIYIALRVDLKIKQNLKVSISCKPHHYIHETTQIRWEISLFDTVSIRTGPTGLRAMRAQWSVIQEVLAQSTQPSTAHSFWSSLDESVRSPHRRAVGCGVRPRLLLTSNDNLLRDGLLLIVRQPRCTTSTRDHRTRR